MDADSLVQCAKCQSTQAVVLLEILNDWPRHCQVRMKLTSDPPSIHRTGQILTL